MTEKGLRREHERGRLVIERIANKDYTTLAYIDEMRRLCRIAVATSPSPENSDGKLQDLLRSLEIRRERLRTEAAIRKVANAKERAEIAAAARLRKAKL